MKKALVCGAGGFIGGHLARRLKDEGFWVRGVDLKAHEHCTSAADEFVIGDLRDAGFCRSIVEHDFCEVYQLAADMGGAGYIFSGDNDADIMHNSATINLNMLDACLNKGVRKIFYSSSACIYPAYNQEDPENPDCSEASAYPAAPDSEYGWEKLFSERLYLAYNRNHGMQNRVARYHNIFGPMGTWDGGKEKDPAAICIGSDEMVSINQLVDMVCTIAGKTLNKVHIDGPLGVRGRNSDNSLIAEKLGWAPCQPLRAGLESTYSWIRQQVEISNSAKTH